MRATRTEPRRREPSRPPQSRPLPWSENSAASSAEHALLLPYACESLLGQLIRPLARQSYPLRSDAPTRFLDAGQALANTRSAAPAKLALTISNAAPTTRNPTSNRTHDGAMITDKIPSTTAASPVRISIPPAAGEFRYATICVSVPERV